MRKTKKMKQIISYILTGAMVISMFQTGAGSLDVSAAEVDTEISTEVSADDSASDIKLDTGITDSVVNYIDDNSMLFDDALFGDEGVAEYTDSSEATSDSEVNEDSTQDSIIGDELSDNTENEMSEETSEEILEELPDIEAALDYETTDDVLVLTEGVANEIGATKFAFTPTKSGVYVLEADVQYRDGSRDQLIFAGYSIDSKTYANSSVANAYYSVKSPEFNRQSIAVELAAGNTYYFRTNSENYSSVKPYAYNAIIKAMDTIDADSEIKEDLSMYGNNHQKWFAFTPDETGYYAIGQYSSKNENSSKKYGYVRVMTAFENETQTTSKSNYNSITSATSQGYIVKRLNAGKTYYILFHAAETTPEVTYCVEKVQKIKTTKEDDKPAVLPLKMDSVVHHFVFIEPYYQCNYAIDFGDHYMSAGYESDDLQEYTKLSNNVLYFSNRNTHEKELDIYFYSSKCYLFDLFAVDGSSGTYDVVVEARHVVEPAKPFPATHPEEPDGIATINSKCTYASKCTYHEPYTYNEHIYDENHICIGCGEKQHSADVYIYDRYTKEGLTGYGLDFTIPYKKSGSTTYSNTTGSATPVEGEAGHYKYWFTDAEYFLMCEVNYDTEKKEFSLHTNKRTNYDYDSVSKTLNEGMFDADNNITLYFPMYNTNKTVGAFTYVRVLDKTTGELISDADLAVMGYYYNDMDSPEPTWNVMIESTKTPLSFWNDGNKYIYGALPDTYVQIAKQTTRYMIGEEHKLYVRDLSDKYIIPEPVTFMITQEEYNAWKSIKRSQFENSTYEKVITVYAERSADIKLNIKNAKTDSLVSGIGYQLFYDKDCTEKILDKNGAEVRGTSAGAVVELKSLPVKWDEKTSTVYVKLTDIPDEYIEASSIVYPIEVTYGDDVTEYDALVSPYTEANDLKVSVVDLIKGEKNLSDFGITVYEYSEASDSFANAITELSFKDGYYYLPQGTKLAETKDNKGLYRLEITKAKTGYEKGIAVNVDISGIYGETIEQVIDVTRYASGDSSLLNILKKDTDGKYEGIISLQTKIGQTTVNLDATNASPYTGVVDKDAAISVILDELKVDEILVKDDVIYTLLLPDTLTPQLDGVDEDFVGAKWTTLTKYGNVDAYGRIIKKNGNYFFEIYFENTSGQYDIEFGFQYSNTIPDQYKDGGKVEVKFPTDDVLTYTVETPSVPVKQLEITKSVTWVDKDRNPLGSNVRSSSNDSNDRYTDIEYTLEITNPNPGSTFSFKIDEQFGSKGMVTIHRYDSKASVLVPFAKVYIDENGDGNYELLADMINSYGAGGICSNYQNSNPTLNGSVIVDIKNYINHSNVSYGTAGINVNVTDVKCEKVKIVYYVSTFYESGVTNQYTTTSVVDYNGNKYTKSATANQYINGPTVSKLDMTPTIGFTANESGIVSNNASDTFDKDSKVKLTLTGNSGHEKFVKITFNQPVSTDYVNSLNYYFAAKYMSGGTNLKPTGMIKIDGEEIQFTSLSPNQRDAILSYANTQVPLALGIVGYYQSIGYDPNKSYMLGWIGYSQTKDRYYMLIPDPKVSERAQKSGYYNQFRDYYGATVLDPKTGLPDELSFYLFGLNGNENIEVTVEAYKRTNAINRSNMDANGDAKKTESLVFDGKLTNTLATANRTNGMTDPSVKNLILEKKAELLEDGAIKYEMLFDVTELKAIYNYSSGNIGTAYDTHGGPVIYEKLPEGYTFSTSYGYDIDNNYTPYSNSNIRSGIVYLLDKDGNYKTSVQSFSRYYGSYIYDTKPAIAANHSTGGYIQLFSLFGNSYYDANLGRHVVRIMYIACPDKASNAKIPATEKLDGITEIVEPYYGGVNSSYLYNNYLQYGEYDAFIIDAVKVASVTLPTLDSKTMVGDVKDYRKWKSTIISGDLSGYDGPFGIHDDMKKSNIFDRAGTKLGTAGKFIKLEDVTVRLIPKTGPNEVLYINLAAESKKQISADKYEYTVVNGKRKVTLTYAPKLGMEEGFDLDITKFDDIAKVVVEYNTGFDDDEFAEAYPKAGVVNIVFDNTAKRRFAGFTDDSRPINVASTSFSITVIPTIMKDKVTRTPDTYEWSYKAEAEIGIRSQDEVYLVDQIEKITEYKGGGVVGEYTSEAAINEWLNVLDRDKMHVRIVAHNRFDLTATEVVLSADGTISPNWNVEAVTDKSVYDNIIVGDGSKKITGNIFGYKLSKKTGVIPKETYFTIEYNVRIDSERLNNETAFRHMDNYQGGLVYIDTHSIIAYQTTASLDDINGAQNGISDSIVAAENNNGLVEIADINQVMDNANIDLRWAAAGAEVEAPYLKENVYSKSGSRDHATDQDNKKYRGESNYTWTLSDIDWTAGRDEYLEHNWNDTMLVSALLDSTQVDDEENAALGDDVLNMAWINLYYKYLTITGWKVEAYNTIDGGNKTELTYQGIDTATGEMVFVESGTDMKVRIKLDALYKSGESTWNFKERNANYTEAFSVYNPWGVGLYFDKYYFASEIKTMVDNKELDAKTPIYGYASNHLFDAVVENNDHLRSVNITYTSKISWDDLFAEADSLEISDEFKGFLEGKRAELDPDFVAVIDKAIEKQNELHEFNQQSGVTPPAKLGLYDGPRYNNVINKAAVDGEIVVDVSSWGYGVEASGSLGKKAKLNDDGSVSWYVTVKTGDSDFLNFDIDDSLVADKTKAEAIQQNTSIAIDYTDLKNFYIKNAKGEILYEYDGTETDKAVITANGEISDGVIDFTKDGAVFSVHLNKINKNSEIIFEYVTAVDYDKFVVNGGDISKEIAETNVASVSTADVDFKTDSSVVFGPKDSSTVEKSTFEIGKNTDNGWEVKGTVGAIDTNYVKLADTQSTSIKNATDFIFYKSMKVVIKDSNGERVIYDTESGIDKLSEEHFTFDDEFELNKNGVYSFALEFNKEKTKGLSLEKNTEIIATYVTGFDSEGFLAAGNKKAHIAVANKAAFTSYPNSTASQTTKENTIVVDEFVSKVGSKIYTPTGKAKYSWTIKVDFTEKYTLEELANATEATITDVLVDTNIIKVVDGGVKLYTIDKADKLAGSIPESEYTVTQDGRRVIIKLNNPKDYPRLRVEIETSVADGVTTISNAAEVSIFGEEESFETEEIPIVTPKADKYVLSKARTAVIKLTKKDSVTDEPIEGAEFLMYAEIDGQWVQVKEIAKSISKKDGMYTFNQSESEDFWEDTLVTNADGIIQVDGILFGKYKLVEVKAADGYELPIDESLRSVEYVVDIDKYVPGPDGVVPTEALLEDELLNNKVAVRVHKTFVEEIVGKMYEGSVEGAVLEVWDKDKTKLLATETTDEKGYAEFVGLVPGEYVLVEKQAPKGYAVAEDIPFTVDDEGHLELAGSSAKEINMIDDVLLGSIKVNKTGDIIKHQGYLTKLAIYSVVKYEWLENQLSSVEFEVHAGANIYLPDGKTKVFDKDQVVDKITTDGDGVAVIDGLPVGSYYLVETKTGDQYKLDKTPSEAVLKLAVDKDGNPIVETYAVDIYNERKTVEITVVKSDDMNLPVVGAIFGLYAAEEETIFNADELIDVVETGKDGKAKFNENLPIGKYYVKELVAPEGYMISEDVYEVDFTKEDTFTFKVVDVARKLSIAKKEVNGGMLGGAKLMLVDSDNNMVCEWTSKANEAYVINYIVPGTYTLYELEAPEGYEVAEPIVIEIKAEDATTIITMYDEKTPDAPDKPDAPDSPKTGDGFVPIVWLAVLLISLGGMMFTVWMKKRED